MNSDCENCGLEDAVAIYSSEATGDLELCNECYLMLLEKRLDDLGQQ